MKKNIILLSILFAAFAGCKKNETPPQPLYLKLPNEVWSYITMPFGSWYIYKDSATSLTDSVNVALANIYLKQPVYATFLGLTGLVGYEDFYNLRLEKVDVSGNKTSWLEATSHCSVSATGTGDYWILGNLMYYSSNLPGSLVMYKIPSASVEGKIYSNIQVVEDGPNSVWWVKDIGIVKLTQIVNSGIKTSFFLRKK